MRYIHLILLVGIVSAWFRIEVKAKDLSPPDKGNPGYVYRGVVVDSIDNEPIVGAYVLAVSPSDTLHTETNPHGHFLIRSGYPLTSIKVMMLGYGIVHIDVPPDQTSCDLGAIKMNSKTHLLDEVVVEAYIKKVVYRGDTIRFNATAFKVNKWASAGELLSKMPGMEVDKKTGSVRFNGKNISVIYVNGKKIFGDDIYSLLTYMDAKDVKNVDAYEELSEEDAHLGTRTGEKRWVLNFKTFIKLIGMMAGHAQTSLGKDEKPDMGGNRHTRYSLGSSVNFFTESKNLSLDAFANDVDRTTNRLEEISARSQLQPGYNKIGAFRAKGYLVKKNWVLHASYGYEGRNNSRTSRTEKIYPLPERFIFRELSDMSHVCDTIRAHLFSVKGQIKPKNLFLSYTIDHSIRKDAKRNQLSNTHRKGDELISEMSNKQTSEKSFFSGYYSVTSWYPLKPKISAGLGATVQINNDGGQSVRVDTILQNVVYRFKERDADENNTDTKVRLSPSLSYYHNPRLTFSGRLEINRDHSMTRNMAIDSYTHIMDSTQTYHYEDDSRSFGPRIGVEYNGKKSKLYATAGWDLTRQKQNDVDQQLYTLPDKLFHAPVLDITYHMDNILRHADQSRLSVTYKNNMVVPGSNMLRPVIIYTNPLYLRGGNPDLTYSYQHRLGTTLNWMKEDRASNLSLIFSYTRNQLDAGRTLFFDETTLLHTYNNFVASAGSSLTTFANIKHQHQLRANFSHDMPIELISGILKTRFGYAYLHNPRYVDNTIINSYSHTPSCEIKLESSVSDHIDLKIASNTSYTHMNRSNMQCNRIFNQRLQTEINSHFFDNKLSLSLFHNGYLIRNINYKEADRSVHLLNLHVGYKFLPRQNAEIGLSAYDLFNKNESFSSTAYPEYLSNIWSRMAGRYLMLNFIYRFKTKLQEKRLVGGYEPIITDFDTGTP